MATEITLNELSETLDDLSYPVRHEAVVDEYGDVQIQLADGETTLAETLAWVEAERFDNESELTNELYAALPRNAVGEPYQSEGEG